MNRSPIAPPSTDFLIVPVQILGIARMDDRTNVLLIDSQTECGSRNHQVDLICAPTVEQRTSLSSRRFAVKTADPVESFLLSQNPVQGLCLADFGRIENRRTRQSPGAL